jgi:hypothetical protein
VFERVARTAGADFPLSADDRRQLRAELEAFVAELIGRVDVDEVLRALNDLNAGRVTSRLDALAVWRYCLWLALEHDLDLEALHAFLAALAAAAVIVDYGDPIVDERRDLLVEVGPWHAPAPPARFLTATSVAERHAA